MKRGASRPSHEASETSEPHVPTADHEGQWRVDLFLQTFVSDASAAGQPALSGSEKPSATG